MVFEPVHIQRRAEGLRTLHNNSFLMEFNLQSRSKEQSEVDMEAYISTRVNEVYDVFGITYDCSLLKQYNHHEVPN